MGVCFGFGWIVPKKEVKEEVKDDCGRDYVERTGKCPICVDCPHNCPLDNDLGKDTNVRSK